jgi:hypothetical protein
VPDTQRSVQLLITPLDDGTYLPREYRNLPAGSMVNNTDWGISEAFTTRNDSIDAHVNNGPDDDEPASRGTSMTTRGVGRRATT